MKDAIISLNQADKALVDTSKLNVRQSQAFIDSKGLKGSIRAEFIHKKDYGKAQNLKGSALDRAHDAYCVQRAAEMLGDITQAAAARKIFLTFITRNAKGTGGTIGYRHDLHVTRETDTSKAELEKQLALLIAAIGGQDKAEEMLKVQAKSTAKEIINIEAAPVEPVAPVESTPVETPVESVMAPEVAAVPVS